MSSMPPVLWKYTFSNFNEKARWALDHKRIPHVRRMLFPGSPCAMWLSRGGRTVPALDLDGRRIVDSTRIIAALEERTPDPPLYPADADERRHALELEDFFDERAGHDLRRVFFWDMRREAAYMARFLATGRRQVARAWFRVSAPVAWAYASRRYAFTKDEVERSRGKLVAALDRIASELDGGDHLVGDSFTVADLAACALLYAVAWPPQFPYSVPIPRRWEFGASLAAHPASEWIRETYWRHRGSSAALRS